MRAHFLRPLSIQENYILKDDSLHHLVNVIRIEKGESLLLLDGEGLSVETVVEEITKRELRLKKVSHQYHERKFDFDLALAMPKREALELCLKEAVELGFNHVYLIKSDYSQMRFLEADRVDKLIISAVEQSNSYFRPMIVNSSWDEIDWESYTEGLLLDSQSKISNPFIYNDQLNRKLLIVGPEGGFSPGELALLHSKKMVRVVNLPTPILRTPTALAAGAGIMLQNLLK